MPSEYLLEHSDQLIQRTPTRLIRYLYKDIHWESRLIGIVGPRGTGKTTMVLQYLQSQNGIAPTHAYLSLDDLYFSTNTLSQTVSSLHKMGAVVIALDEVHKYPGWAREIKNIYDRFPTLKIIFTGSSIIDLTAKQYDLSRRAILYELSGMSYREYLYLKHGLSFEVITLESVLTERNKISSRFPIDFRPLQYFEEYLRQGYYPFFMENETTYAMRLNKIIRTIVEYDIAEIEGFDIRNSKKLLQLLMIIAGSVPFKPNISRLSEKIDINRRTLMNYLHLLEQARLISLMHPHGKSTSLLQKPEKVYLDNPNLAWAVSEGRPDIGNLREIFVRNQLAVRHKVNYTSPGDFLIDGQLTLEIGGKNKGNKQIDGLKNAWIVSDQLEYPTMNRIPLWLLGFLY
jgi:uncharacterized protein